MNFENLSKKKWIFVGGKGGVGKTSTSCSLGLTFADEGRKTLIVSTDPAHNLSDAFSQKFSHDPSPVENQENLFCVEIDPKIGIKKFFEKKTSTASDFQGSSLTSDPKVVGSNPLENMISSIPGIDEAMTFHLLISSEHLKTFDKIIFDTAPTGHTLRLLGLPEILDSAFTHFLSMKSSLSPFMSLLNMTNINGNSNNSEDFVNFDYEKIFDKVETLKANVEDVRRTLSDEEQCTFVCVAIPEFLSLYETERLIMGLDKFGVNCSLIAINQIVEKGNECDLCQRREKIHKEFLEQFDVLYGDEYKLVKLPVMDFEVRGCENLKRVGKMIKSRLKD